MQIYLNVKFHKDGLERVLRMTKIEAMSPEKFFKICIVSPEQLKDEEKLDNS